MRLRPWQGGELGRRVLTTDLKRSQESGCGKGKEAVFGPFSWVSYEVAKGTVKPFWYLGSSVIALKSPGQS